MGYSLYITRRIDWSDRDGPAISLAEWVSFVESDPELRWEPDLGKHFAIWDRSPGSDVSWLAWENGVLESKHPDREMIRKLLRIAEALSARVIGEEGEGYDSNGDEVVRSTPLARADLPGLWQRAWAFLRGRSAADPGLPVGCRVQDALGRFGTVASIDLRAASGLGSIVVRYEDGRTVSFAAVAHGLERADPAAGGV